MPEPYSCDARGGPSGHPPGRTQHSLMHSTDKEAHPWPFLKVGRGKPLTLFAPGGNGENLASRMSYIDRVKGTKIGFAYEDSGHFESIAKIRRQADRDAAEIL